jgi:hypothetical protein
VKDCWASGALLWTGAGVRLFCDEENKGEYGCWFVVLSIKVFQEGYEAVTRVMQESYLLNRLRLYLRGFDGRVVIIIHIAGTNFIIIIQRKAISNGDNRIVTCVLQECHKGVTRVLRVLLKFRRGGVLT